MRDKRFASAARRMLWNTVGPLCHYCRCPTNKPEAYWEIRGPRMAIAEHKTPLSRGGPDTLANIVLACRDCDEIKGTLTAEEFEAAVMWGVAHGVAPLERLPGQHLMPLRRHPAWIEYFAKEVQDAQVAVA
jgi:hypothetical protein